jgi:hypothetical protein
MNLQNRMTIAPSKFRNSPFTACSSAVELIVKLVEMAAILACFFAESKAAVSLPPVRFTGTSVLLADWAVFGPLSAPTDLDGLKVEQTAAFGMGEKDLVGGILYSADSRHGYEKLPLRLFEEHGLLDFYDLYGLEKQDDEHRPCFYAQTRVDSVRESPAVLLFGSDGMTKVFINGALVYTKTSRRQFETFDAVVPLVLKRGSNVITFKVVRPNASCGLVARLEPTSESALRCLLEMDGTCLTKLLLPTVPDQTILLPTTRQLVDAKITVISPELQEGNVDSVKTASASANDRTRSVLSTATVTWPTGQWHEMVLVGAVDTAVDRVLRRVSSIHLTQQSNIDLRASVRRIKLLLDISNRKPGDREWERKVIYTIAELEAIADEGDLGAEKVAGGPGLHLRGFKSRTNGAEEHYRLFVPSGYSANGPPLPVAIMLATAFSGSRPFIESAFVAHQLDAEHLGRIAEHYGIAILWSGYPCQPYGHLCEFAHFEEVLNDVSARYRIDEKRIWLLGTCQAGMTATMIAERWPHRFAAVALQDPIAARTTNRPDEDSEVAETAAYRHSVEEAAPLLHLADVEKIPFLVQFDGPAKSHGSREEADSFVAIAHDAGVAVEYEHCASSLYHMEGWGRLINWLSEKRCDSPSTGLSPRADTSDRRVGPIEKVFCDRFVVVVGTNATGESRLALDVLVNHFDRAWAASRFQECQHVLDAAVTPELERDCNLVLIGNDTVNSVWRELAPWLPITMSDAGISIGSIKENGRRLSVQAVFTNPRYRQRRILLIGSPDLQSAAFGTLELSIDGLFDFAVWRKPADSESPELVRAERYPSSGD